MRMRVFLSAGEASGDAYAAALVRELKARNNGLLISGVGGPRLREEIGFLAADSSTWGAISIVQSLAVAPRALLGYRIALKALSSGEPGLFVPIDFGFFNIRIARKAREKGWKVLYFVPPGSWRRDKQGADLPALTDAIATPFPWSADLLQQMGANAHFFGHPIKQLIRESTSGVGAVRDRLAVLPGSRAHELERNLPLIAAALEARPLEPSSGGEGMRPIQTKVEFAVAPSVDLEGLRTSWAHLAPAREDLFTRNDVYGVLRRARAAIVCSGTATLEAALLRCPMVVIYQVSKTMVAEAKVIGFKQPEHIALPNICLQRRLVTELVGEKINPLEVNAEVESLLNEGALRERQMKGFEELDRILGDDDAISHTADLAMSLIESRSSR